MHRLLKNLKDIFGKNGFSTFFMVAALLAKLFQLRTLRSWIAEHSHYIHIPSHATKSFQRFFLGTPVELIPYNSSSINKTISILCVHSIFFGSFCFFASTIHSISGVSVYVFRSQLVSQSFQQQAKIFG